jgi:hypothetical protein
MPPPGRSVLGFGTRTRTILVIPPPPAQRLLWFALLWLGGVGTVILVSLGLRLWFAPK